MSLIVSQLQLCCQFFPGLSYIGGPCRQAGLHGNPLLLLFPPYGAVLTDPGAVLVKSTCKQTLSLFTMKLCNKECWKSLLKVAPLLLPLRFHLVLQEKKNKIIKKISCWEFKKKRLKLIGNEFSIFQTFVKTSIN